jgi:hypothetical protein
MNPAKIQLSAEEMELVQNSQWLLTKNTIIGKVSILFGWLAQQARAFINANKIPLLPEVMQLSPKISKGNQYHGLPYLMLDYPRYFGKEDVFAIRSFFWWGNYFSVTLHLKGKYKDLYSGNYFQTGPAREWFYYDNRDDEWGKDASEANYMPSGQIANSSMRNG